jgi:hypothetical protein
VSREPGPATRMRACRRRALAQRCRLQGWLAWVRFQRQAAWQELPGHSAAAPQRCLPVPETLLAQSAGVPLRQAWAQMRPASQKIVRQKSRWLVLRVRSAAARRWCPPTALTLQPVAARYSYLSPMAARRMRQESRRAVSLVRSAAARWWCPLAASTVQPVAAPYSYPWPMAARRMRPVSRMIVRPESRWQASRWTVSLVRSAAAPRWYPPAALAVQPVAARYSYLNRLQMAGPWTSLALPLSQVRSPTTELLRARSPVVRRRSRPKVWTPWALDPQALVYWCPVRRLQVVTADPGKTASRWHLPPEWSRRRIARQATRCCCLRKWAQAMRSGRHLSAAPHPDSTPRYCSHRWKRRAAARPGFDLRVYRC